MEHRVLSQQCNAPSRGEGRARPGGAAVPILLVILREIPQRGATCNADTEAN